MKRIYHPWQDREECGPGGMWRNVGVREREGFAMVTADLMAFPEQFEAAMLRALDEWPNSCDAALTQPNNNQQAWLGHAGCYLATGSPEDCTRLGWHQLNASQQLAANEAADRVIAEWKKRRRLKILGGQIPLWQAAA